MESLEPVVSILRHRNLAHLADLLKNSYVVLEESDQFGSYRYSILTTAAIYAPIGDYDKLRSLPNLEEKQIFETVLDIWPPRAYDMEITGVVYRLNRESLEDKTDDKSSLLKLIGQVESTLIAVATGGPSINSVNQEYKERYLLLTEQLQSRGLQNPIPYSDLWDWYGKWSSGTLPSYKSRREYIRSLVEPLEKRLQEGPEFLGAGLLSEPIGWHRVDRNFARIRSQLSTGSNEEDFQAIGLWCREALITVAQMVFDPVQHPPIDDKCDVSNTDAKRMLERYLAVRVGGKTNEVSRRCAKASLDLANELQHLRTATYQEAALCVSTPT